MGNATQVLDSSVVVSTDAGEPAAVASRMRHVVDAHFDFVWRVLRRMGVSAGDADDAAQKCFLVFAQRLASIGESEERAFLFQTAVRIALAEHRRVKRRREDGEGALPTVVDPGLSPEAMIEREWARRILDAVLDTMPTDLRAAFVLFELEGFTLRQVASVLGVPQGTAASRVRRARKLYDDQVQKLRARMDRGRSQ